MTEVDAISGKALCCVTLYVVRTSGASSAAEHRELERVLRGARRSWGHRSCSAAVFLVDFPRVDPRDDAVCVAAEATQLLGGQCVGDERLHCATCAGAASESVWKPLSVRMALVNRPSAGSGSRRTRPRASRRLKLRKREAGSNLVDMGVTPSGLARRARAVWQCQHVPPSSGPVATIPDVPRIRLPSGFTQPLRRPGGKGLSPRPDHLGASWRTAPGRRNSRLPAGSRWHA